MAEAKANHTLAMNNLEASFETQKNTLIAAIQKEENEYTTLYADVARQEYDSAEVFRSSSDETQAQWRDSEASAEKTIKSQKAEFESQATKINTRHRARGGLCAGDIASATDSAKQLSEKQTQARRELWSTLCQARLSKFADVGSWSWMNCDRQNEETDSAMARAVTHLQAVRVTFFCAPRRYQEELLVERLHQNLAAGNAQIALAFELHYQKIAGLPHPPPKAVEKVDSSRRALKNSVRSGPSYEVRRIPVLITPQLA
jgi:hypothetical protein